MRVLLAIAAVVVLTTLQAIGVAASLDSPAALRLWHDFGGWVGSLLGVVGAWMGMTAFSRGDHLRRVWALLTISAACLLIGTALRSHWTHTAPGRDFLESPLLAPRAVVVLVANVLATWALVMLVLTYRRSGLRPPWTGKAIVLWVVVGTLAVLLGARQLWIDLGRLHGFASSVSALTSIASTLGDTVTILLIVPILRVAYLMRGGRLAWVWWALGLSGAVWLIYDGREWIAAVLPGSKVHNLELLRVLRTPGLALVGLAGFLQREALRDPAAR